MLSDLRVVEAERVGAQDLAAHARVFQGSTGGRLGATLPPAIEIAGFPHGVDRNGAP
jgi:hypothetical protein